MTEAERFVAWKVGAEKNWRGRYNPTRCRWEHDDGEPQYETQTEWRGWQARAEVEREGAASGSESQPGKARPTLPPWEDAKVVNRGTDVLVILLMGMGWLACDRATSDLLRQAVKDILKATLEVKP